MSDTRDALVAEARSWIGTPWRKYGRMKGVAADCIFLEEVGRVVLGYPKRHTGYSLVPKDRELERIADRDLVLVSEGPRDLASLLPGNLALFTGANPDEPQHFGMIAIHPSRGLEHVRTLIHATGQTPTGRVIEQSMSTSKLAMKRLRKVYKFPGV